MKKLAANYVVTESGDFLKNSYLVAEDDGMVLNFVDTGGHLQEIAQLIFYNGILLPAFRFERVRSIIAFSDEDPRFASVLLADTGHRDELSMADWLKLCKDAQANFPDMILPEVFRRVTETLVQEGGFAKESVPGVYLLTGSSLVILKLTENSRLKRLI